MLPTETAAGPGRAATVLGPWADALLATVVTLLAMAALATAGLWLAGADDLPGSALPAVVAATVLMAVGVPVQLTGGAAFLAEAHGDLSALPLSVTLLGALALARLFLRPLRLRAVATPGELAGRAARTAVLWLALLLLLRPLAQHSFTIRTGDPLADELGAAFDAAPTAGFRTGLLPTLGLGLLWLALVLLLTLVTARGAPLPPRLLRYRAAVRPAAHAVLTLLLCTVVLGLLAGLVSATVDGHPRRTLAVLLLALPNLAWLALGVGFGASWHGSAGGDLGLPVPHLLTDVLRTSDHRDVTLDLGTLAAQDGRAWLLAALVALLLLLTGLGAALHSPPDLPLWRYAAQLAAALALAMVLIGLLTRISAEVGLSLLGFDAAGGGLSLSPDLLRSVPLAAAWGGLAGLLGALAARPLRSRPTAPTSAAPESGRST
ncbi:streptophobe family protein [Kitasatospora sp. CMC57]|uniref:Streptophobe family protein n=1 Tax=Kitasatospora sp. CMC57 TaxID=3231513 RepID=A0AB33K365_9ACTN